MKRSGEKQLLHSTFWYHEIRPKEQRDPSAKIKPDDRCRPSLNKKTNATNKKTNANLTNSHWLRGKHRSFLRQHQRCTRPSHTRSECSQKCWAKHKWGQNRVHALQHWCLDSNTKIRQHVDIQSASWAEIDCFRATVEKILETWWPRQVIWTTNFIANIPVYCVTPISRTRCSMLVFQGSPRQ